MANKGGTDQTPSVPKEEVQDEARSRQLARERLLQQSWWNFFDKRERLRPKAQTAKD